MSVPVYLADLRYNYSGVLANDCMPLGVAYMKAVMDRDLPDVASRLFVYPDQLSQVLATAPPAVLMLTNYCWNERLSLHFAKLAKRIAPGTLTVLGGPNISIDEARRLAYMAEHPEIDVYVLGEGDFLATEVVRAFLDAGMSLEALAGREIPSSICRRPDGTLAAMPMRARHRQLDDIPSPWLTGIQDEFFDGKLAPLLETNRGCPFTCTFCVQGIDWYTKVHYFDKERIKDEIEYIARRIKQVCPSQGTLRIADSNYGMFERDIELSAHIGEVMKKYGYPKYIDATTGKNRPDRIIKSVEKASGALLVYQAVQSLDENVLRNIKRQNIQLKAYEQLHVHMRGRGLRSNSDLILGLPGETLDTHLTGCRKLLDAGTNQVTNFQLMMLKGSELETEESRQTFSFDSRFRILPKNFGVYGGERVFDVEEIVVATDTLPFDDYVQARKYALASVAFWHDNLFEDAFQFAQGLGLKRSQFWDALVPAMERASGPLRQFVDSFVAETVRELFPTREACVEFYSRDENFERLLTGEIGDNLMHKYHAIACFHIWPDICRAGMDTMRGLLVDRGLDRTIPDFDRFWASFHRYLEFKHAYGHSVEEILSPRRTLLEYDIDRWIADGLSADPTPYRLAAPEPFEFSLTQEGIESLGAALEVWTTSLKGLTKMVTRIKVAWQVHTCRRSPGDGRQNWNRAVATFSATRAAAAAAIRPAVVALLLAATLAVSPAGASGQVSVNAELRASRPIYRLTPGDVIDIKFSYNPELNETVTLRPDGRITLQRIGEIDAENMTATDLAETVGAKYARLLRQPEVAVIVRDFAGQRAYVGGEVAAPGLVALKGRVTVLQALLNTGGPKASAKLSDAVLLRHLDGNRAEARKLDLTKVLQGQLEDPQMQAYDVLFVPRSGIGKVNLFVEQYINGLLPRNLLFPYNLNTTVSVKP
jgi:protein involved in polysaccharide export with SLBB domain/radical SAM superfamily enzyme YgiQ (UPF0313 family)